MDDLPPDDPARAATVQRRWRVFLAVEALLVLVFVSLAGVVIGKAPGTLPWLGMAFGLLGAWLGFSLPVAFLYLIGKPPVMSLSPLIPSAESRAFRRTLRGRPELSDAEFFAQYYAGSGVSEETVRLVRQTCARYDPLLSRVIPTDPMYFIDDDLDFPDLVWEVGKVFGFKAGPDVLERIDGTFDNLVRLTHARLRAGE